MKFFGVDLGHVVRETGIALVVERAMNALDKGIQANGAEFIKKVMTRLTDDHRALFWAYVGGLDDRLAIEGLRAHHARWMAMGIANMEDRFTNILGRLYVAMVEAKDFEGLERSLKEMGHMDAGTFDRSMTALENDVIAQWFKRARQLVGEVVLSAWNGAKTAAKKADDKLAPVADSLEQLQERRRRARYR